MSDARGGARSAWLAFGELVVYVVVAFALYAPALSNPYLIDDALIVVEHPDVNDPERLGALFRHHYWEGVRKGDANLYRPLTILSFHLNGRLLGLAPAAVRAVNVAWLGLLAALFARWLRRCGVARLVAFSLGLLLLAHPLQACVTNYVVGRSDLQVLLGIVGFLGCQRAAQGHGRWTFGNAAAAAGFALLAFGSKESGVLLLPAALFAGWCARERGTRVATALLAGVPFAVYFAVRASIVGAAREYGPGFAADPLMNPLIGAGFLERLPAALSLLAFHVRQVVVPDPSFYHVPDVPPGWGDASTWMGVVLLVLGVAALVGTLRRRSLLAVPLALAGAQWALVGQLVMPLAFYAANRLMGPFLVAAFAAPGLATRGRLGARGQGLVAAACALAFVPMALSVRDIGRHWSSAEGMAALDFERHPSELDSIVAWTKTLVDLQRNAEAAEHAARAVERRPEFAEGWFLLATAKLALGELDAARRGFERVLALTEGERATKSVRARALINLGGAEIAAGDLAAGRRRLREAEVLWPGDFRLLTNLARLAEHERDAAEQARCYRRIAEEHPGRANAWLAKLARLGDAERKRGEAFQRVDLHEQALTSFDVALVARPDDPELHWRRAVSLVALGRSDEARAAWELARVGLLAAGASDRELTERAAGLFE